MNSISLASEFPLLYRRNLIIGMTKREKESKEITKDNDDKRIYSRLHDASNNKQRKPITNTQNGALYATAKKKPNSASMMNLLQRNFFLGEFFRSKWFATV